MFIKPYVLLLTLLLALGSCGQSSEEKVNSAVREANFFLNRADCSNALRVLREVEQERPSANFVAVMSSAIACQAGYNDNRAILNLIEIDVNATGFLSSFAAFATSDETSADASSYVELVAAIEYILNADGGSSPSTINRLDHFGRRAGNDLSMRALLMSTVALGKFLAFYGNTDALGVKGNGSGSNSCLINYLTDAQMNGDLVADDAGSNIWMNCNSGNDGHPDLNSATLDPDIYKRRVCEGIVLFNNMFEIVTNIDISDNDSLGELRQVQSTIETLYLGSAALAASRTWGNAGGPINTIRDITSQTECEARTNNEIEIFYLAVFEAFLQ